MSDDSEGAWWKTLLASILFIGIGIYLFYDFSDFETMGGTRRINWLVAWLYNLTGKWVTCGLIVGMGAIGMWKSFEEWKDER